MSDLEIRVEAYDGPVASALIAAVQAEYVERYGGPDESLVDPAEFSAPGGTFLVGYLDGEPVACGGVRALPGGSVDVGSSVGEIKRMFVVRGFRGRGLSRVVLAALEDAARGLGYSRLVLETGSKQPEAVSLYLSSGYEPTEPFGHYRCSPLSRSYAKVL